MRYKILLTNRVAKLLAFICLFGPAASITAKAYQLVDLGENVNPQDINNSRTVVGSRNTDQYPTLAFRWTQAGGFEDLDGTVANAVNDNEEITGNTLTGAFFYDGNKEHYLGDDYTGAGMNSLGQVAGSRSKDNPYRATPRPVDPAIYDPTANGQKWTVLDVANVYSRGTRKGVYADLYSLWDINDVGKAVGKKSRYGLSGTSAFLIEPPYQSVTFLPIPNGGYASAINNQNLIVGTTGSNSTSGEFAHAFLYDYVNGNLTDLGTLNDGLTSSASDINDSNQVVGSSWLVTQLTSIYDPTQYHAFLWENYQMTDLNSLTGVADSGWILTAATAINENGDIVGTGLFNGQLHGFLLINDTVPPPPAGETPVAMASADPPAGKVPLTVKFSSDGSYDPDGTLVSYVWDFGDGAPVSTTANSSHEYTVPGTYFAQLTVTDEQGLSATAQVTIQARKSKRRK